MKVQNWLSVSADANPERPALVSGRQSLSFRQLERLAAGAASHLADLGLGRREIVATTLPVGLEFGELLHGSIRAGVALAPIDPALPDRERAQALDALGGPPLIEERSWEELEPGPGPIELDDSLCVIRTSGSSGPPRWVKLTAGNHLWSAVGCGMRIELTGEDRWHCCLPVHHIGGLAIFARTAIYGATAVLERFDAERTYATLRRQEITVTSLVATMLARLVELGPAPESLRCVLLGGGPAPGALLDRALARGWPIAPTYGMTETCSQVTTLAPEEFSAHRGSAGRPLSSTEIRIDEAGAILVRGKTVAPEMKESDGWFHTNDLGYLDEDGYLHVSGRADEVLITGGENVSPEEIETVVAQCPGVADVAVFGRPDDEWQTALIAAVVLSNSTIGEKELRRHCAEHLEPFKVPKRFEFVESLPRNPQGKLLRRQLR